MRTAFINTLMELAAKDKRIFLVTGDLGYSVLETFQEKFPDRFLNVGVAEQSMIGTAAGLALSGKIPITYSICTFATLRPFEFIRNDVCYQNLNVKMVGVGAGLSYPQYGLTHQSIDDIAIMRTLANLTILNPGDPIETELATKAAIKHRGPVYLRIGKKGEPNIHQSQPSFKIGQAITVKDGRDITIIATGNMLENASRAVALLQKKNISVRFVSMPTLKPIDEDAIQRSAKETKAIFTIEEHFVNGGLGTAVGEVLLENGMSQVSFHKIALPNKYPPEIGSQNYLRNIYGLTPEKIAAKIKKLLK